MYVEQSQCMLSVLTKRRHVKNLVGEIDFSYRAIKSSSASSFEDDSDDEKSKVE